jgi:hypothetical protein
MLRLLGVLALTTLWIGASASAQEREARLQSGPMTERPIAIMSGQTDGPNIAQADNCQAQAAAKCKNLCDQEFNPTPEACLNCKSAFLTSCKGK